MNNAYFSKYLYSFLDNHFGNLDKISAKITDVEPELLDGFVVDSSSAYSIVIVKEDDFSEAVEIRNNPKILRIILISLGNADFVDSLKDFEPYSIIPEIFDEFKSIIEKVFDLHIETEQSNYLGVIFSEKKVSLEIFLQYIQNSIENGALSNKLLNENLNLLRFWKISSESLYVYELRKSIKNSSEAKIERQMKKAFKDTEKFKKIKNASKISECILQGNFSGILNIAYWEDVKEFLVTNISKTDHEKDNSEENKIYSNSFEYLFDNLDKFDSIEALEADMQDDVEDYEDDFCEYKSINKDVEFFNEFNRNLHLLMLNSDKKVAIKEAANKLEISYKGFCDSNITPKELNSFCELSEDYLKDYFSLICLVISENKIAKCFHQYGLADTLQSFNINKSSNMKEIDYYHPISVCYFHNLRRYYCDCLRALKSKSEGSYERIMLMPLINKYLPTWPIEYFIFDNKKYIATSFLNQPIGQAMLQPVSGASSLEVIDFRAIAKIITDFCSKKRMFNEYNVAIVGDPQILNMQAFFEIINRLFVNGDLLLEKIIISFICNDESQIKNSIANIYKNGGFSEKIFFKFCKVDRWQEISWNDDLTIFLDASMLYECEKFTKIYADKNAISGEINKAVKEPNLHILFNSDSRLLRIVWDTLQNVFTENSSELVLWENSEIRYDMLEKIRSTVNDSNKEVCVLSKNMNLLDEINLPTVQIDKNMFPVGRKNILKVIFSNNEDLNASIDDNPTISIDINKFYIETIFNIPYETFSFAKPNIFNIKFDGSCIIFIYQGYELDEEGIFDIILKMILCEETTLEKNFKRDFIQFVRNNTCNVNQMVLCYLMENYDPEKIKFVKDDGTLQKSELNQVPRFANYGAQIIFDKIFNGIGIYDYPDDWDVDIIKKIYKGSLEFPDIYNLFGDKLKTFFNIIRDRGIEYE